MKKYELFDNTQDGCYEFRINGDVAKIEYEVRPDGNIALVYTEVPNSLQGQEVGVALVRACLEDIEKQGKKVAPRCGFVKAYIRKNPEWERLVI